MKKENKSYVGFDRNYKEIYPGDVIQDYLGKRYTITSTGLAKSADGAEVKLSSLHGPELIQDGREDADAAAAATYQKTVLKATEKMRPKKTAGYVAISAIARSVDAPARGCVEAVRAAGIEIKKSGSASLVKEEDQEAAKQAILARSEDAKGSGRKDVQPKRRGAKKLVGGRTNKSGLVRIASIARTCGVVGRGYTDLIRSSGIEVLADEQDKACVRKEDHARAAKVLLDKFILGKDPAKEEEKGAAQDPAILSVEEAGIVTNDQALVDELRRRGWTVTCKKMVEVEL